MKKLLLLAICFSFNAEAVTVSNSCVASCTTSCQTPKKAVKKPVKKGKKHAKKLQKKAVVKPDIVDQKTQPTKCEPVTEYVYLSGFDAGWRGMQLPDMPSTPASDGNYRESVSPRGSFNAPLINPAAYAITNTRYVFTPAKPYPIKHDRHDITQTPLPASAWLFVSGLAVFMRRKFK